jgi:acetyltransferase-like isoleucine patch superfamily enzyme
VLYKDQKIKDLTKRSHQYTSNLINKQGVRNLFYEEANFFLKGTSAKNKLTINELMTAYKRFTVKTRGAWYKHEFQSVGSGLEVKGKLEIRGLGKVLAGKNLHLSENVGFCTFTDQSEIQIGDNVNIGGHSFIGAHGQLIIGDNTAIAGGVTILDTDWRDID